MQSPFFSIIVGVYNVSHFFLQGINQLLAQTFTDFEIILVDDGSTDECPSLCDEWAAKDDRIVVIHKQNGGLGSARNAGLDVAKGRYIWSMDMDDDIEPDVLEHLYKYAKETFADVLCFGYIEHDLASNTTKSFSFSKISCRCNQEVRDIFIDELLGLKFPNGFFWNKLYSRTFIEQHHLRFEDQRIQQDEVFNLKVYKCVNHLELIPGVFYHYNVYATGNNRSRYIKERFEIVKSVRTHFDSLSQYWHLEDSRLDEYLDFRFLKGIIQCISVDFFHIDNHMTIAQKKKEFFRLCSDEYTQHVINDKSLHNKGFYFSAFVKVLRMRSWILLRIVLSFFHLKDYLFNIYKNISTSR